MFAAAKLDQLDLFEEGQAAEPLSAPATAENLGSCERCQQQYLSDHEVAERFSTSRATVWRWVQRNPSFPRPVKISAGTTRWRLSDLVRFETETLLERSGSQPRPIAGASE